MSEPLHQQQDSSAVLYHASISKESLQSKLDDRSSSTSSDSKKTKSSSKSTGFTSRLSEQYSTTLISLLFKKPIPQWLLWLFHVYIIYGSLSVPFERGDVIVSSQAIPRTLAADWYSYEAFLILCAILFFFQIITCIALYLSLSTLQKGNNFAKITTNLVRISACMFAIFNLIFTYWMTTFLACDDKSNMLRRFPLTQCWSQTNIVYMVIAIIFIMVQIPLSVIGLFILFSSAGTFPKHPTIISMDSFFFIALLSVVNQVYLFISQFIPPDGVLARPILNVVLSLVPLSFLLYERPFTFTRMNSLYSGILFAKWGGSVAAIVAITVNKSNSLDLGLSFLLGIGLGSVLLLFGIGFGVAELIHFFMKTRARHARAQFDESHGSGKHIFNDNLLRLCFKSNLFSDEIDEEMLKYANSRKSIMSTNALIASAVYTHRFHDNPQLTLATLKYALRHSNFIQKLVIRAMIQDIELYYGLQTTSEVRSLLEKTSLLQEKLLQIRKLFWQYFVANEDDYDKISDLVYSMYSIEKSIVMIFSHLLANYPENQNILKRRNVFMQEFLFEISSPLTEQTTGRSSTDLYDEEKQKTRKAIQDLKLQKRRSTSLLFTENVYREAINSKVDTKKTSCYFLTAELVSILLILVVLLLGVFTTLEGNHVQFLKQSCDLIPVPFSLLKEIYLLQYPSVNNDTILRFKQGMKTIEEFTEKGKISDFRILATDKFLMQYFSENNFPMKIPTLGAPNMATDFTYQNMSITSLMSNLAIVSQNLFELNNDALKNIRSTYEYNFLMLNSEAITTALQDFCNSITKILLYEDNNNNTIVITISVIIGSYSTLIIIYLITTNLIINTKKKIIGIFAKIPKDVVGNQFHILEKQTNQKSTSHTRSIFNFSRKMVIIVFVVASLTILSMAVSFYEAFKAAYENNVAVEKTQYVTQVLSSTSHQQANILAWTFDNFSQTTQNMALRKQILLEQQNLEKSWTLLRFGSKSFPTNIKSISTAITPALEGICTNTSANCEPGLDTLMESYALSVNALFYSNSTTLLQPLTSQLIELSGYIFKSMNHISDVILQSTIGLRVPISVAVSCTGIALIIVLSIFHFSQLEQQAEENYHLRRLLNSLPTDTISQIEEIKKFVLYNSLAERKKDSHKASKVQVILDGSNDGAIVLKPKSTMIDIINSTALKMLGYNSGELLDLMAIFGEGESRSKLSMILEVFFSSKQSVSEYIEMEALRKNGSTLAVGVSISVYTYENKNLITVLLRDITSEKKHKLLLEEERQKSDALLLNILPERIASRLKAGESCISEKFDDISCLFSDMVGFTKMSSGLSAHELVQLLNAIINGFDHLIPMFGLEKIKTIGDAYFCIGGISGQSNHPEQIILFALHMLDVIAKYNKQNNKSLNVRIGLHVGPIIAGCIGNLKFAYDLWGETLNIAQAMESKGFPGRIQVSRKMYERVYDIFEFDEIKGVEIKPSVVMNTYLLKEKHHDIANFHVGSDQSFEKMFSKVNLHEPTSYNFKKLITDSTFTSLYKEYLSGSVFLDMLVFYQHAMEYANNASTPVRFGISKQLVKEYLAETAPKRLKFKFMRNAFGPFQLKFQECTEDNCPTDLFENFTNLCMKHLKEEFANFLKSNNFAKFLDQKRKNPESLKACLRGENDSSTTDEEDEKEFLLFCQKCGTEIINKENHRFNDWEFNHRSEILYDMNQWRKIFEISGGATYFSPPETHNHLSNSRRHVQVKYVYEMNCSHEELFYAWIDEDSFSTRFEKIISSVKIDFVKVAKYAHAVFHEIYKMKYLHQTKRELVHAYCCRYDPTKDVYMCVTRSINNAKVPETDKYVRAEIKTAFLVEKVTDSKCRYYYSVIFDPMGWLKPEYYHESIYKETPQNNFHMKLLKLVDKRSKEGRSVPKGPLFDSLTYYINQTQQEKKKKTLNITKEENLEDPQQVSV